MAGVEVVDAQDGEGLDPVDRLGHTRGLVQVEVPEPVDRGHDLAGHGLGDAGQPGQDDRHLALGSRIADPVVQAPALEGVVQLPGAVGGQDHEGRRVGPDGADLGDGDLEVREQLEQEGLELVVGPIDLVDEQHRLVTGAQGVEQGSLEQELGTEEGVDRVLVRHLVLGEGPDLQHLAGVVPLVEGLVGVDALVALQADQAPPRHGGQRLGHLGLADPHLTLQEKWTAERPGDEDGRGQSTVGEVAIGAQQLGELADTAGAGTP